MKTKIIKFITMKIGQSIVFHSEISLVNYNSKNIQVSSLALKIVYTIYHNENSLVSNSENNIQFITVKIVQFVTVIKVQVNQSSEMGLVIIQAQNCQLAGFSNSKFKNFILVDFSVLINFYLFIYPSIITIKIIQFIIVKIF